MQKNGRSDTDGTATNRRAMMRRIDPWKEIGRKTSRLAVAPEKTFYPPTGKFMDEIGISGVESHSNDMEKLVLESRVAEANKEKFDFGAPQRPNGGSWRSRD